jgi:hypothetical protein
VLGTASKLSYISADDFNSSADYLKYMYGQSKGLIARSTIHEYYYEDFNRSNIIVKRPYEGVENVYTSMNTFCKCDRKTEQLKRLNALYVDLDCYKLNMSKESVLMELYDDYFGSKIPVPTFVIDSGRGLYLIWKINEDRNALPRWTSVMNYIFNACITFNADPACKDASRILRVPFSINSKSGTAVKILDFNDVTYTLHEIIREYGIQPSSFQKKMNNDKNFWGKPTVRMKQYASVIAEQKGLELPDFESYEETFSFIADNQFAHGELAEERTGNIIYFAASNKKPMLDGRCHDLERLFAARHGEDCKREIGLFLYRLWLCEATNNYDYALNMTLLFNQTLKFPLEEKYVMSRTASAEKIVKKGNSYRYSRKRIIEILQITDEEMTGLSYLNLCDAPSSDAKKARNRRAYLTRLEEEGKETKITAVRTRREQIAALVADGKEKAEICSLLNISTRTYERDMIVIVAEDFIGRARIALEEKANKIMDTAEKAVESVLEAFESMTETFVEAAENAVCGIATKFQPSYYTRTPEGCSAVGCSIPTGVFTPRQLTLWDFLGKNGGKRDGGNSS